MVVDTHMTLTGEAQISAYLHRMRMDILAALRDGPSTISQIGSKLGVHPANLTRHVRKLVDAGLVELSHTRDTGRNLEKYYRSVADTFDVAPGADELSAPHKIALEFSRSDLSAAIAQLPEELEGSVLALLATARLRKSDLSVFCRRLKRLIEEFEAADVADGLEYHLNLSLYPGSWVAGGRVSLERVEDPE